MSWRTRKRGTCRQVGNKFPVEKKRLPPRLRGWQRKISTTPSEHSFNRFAKNVVDSAREELEKYGSVYPAVLVRVPLERASYRIELPANKKKWRKKVEKIVKESGASHYAVVTEGFMAPPTKEGLLPSAHPFKKDIVFITVYSRDGKKHMKTIEFEYISPKQVAVKKVEDWPKFKDSLVGDVFER